MPELPSVAQTDTEGGELTTYWPPDHEVYCTGCHRMVAADARGTPAWHYRYAANNQGNPLSRFVKYTTRCPGGRVRPEIRLGTEDSGAAFADVSPPVTLVSQTEVKVAPATTSGSSPSARLFWGRWTG